MPILQSRRRFLTNAALAGTAALGGVGAIGLGGGRKSFAAEPPPEITSIRLPFWDYTGTPVNGVSDIISCDGPMVVARELLPAEGFTDIRYVHSKGDSDQAQMFAHGEIDFCALFAPHILLALDNGAPLTTLAGMHPGCFELFAHEHVRTFTDLRGKQVGIESGLGSVPHIYLSIMVARIGLDPKKDIKWITPDDAPNVFELYKQGRIDAYFAFFLEQRDLRARKIGRSIVDMARDKPWSNYFCCMVVGHTDFVRKYPVATKRVTRAILKATELCSAEPEQAARSLVEANFAEHYDIAVGLLMDLPYGSWRELDPEDTLRFYALWMHEFGRLKSTPNKLIGEGTDWRFLDEIKRELKT